MQVPEATYTQKTFTLDLDNPVFEYEENALNDSSYAKDLVFSTSENITVGVRLPKNSTILYSNITLKGESFPSQTYATDEVWGLAVGNVDVSTSDNEMAVAVTNGVNLLDSAGNPIWNFPNTGFYMYDAVIGDVSTDEGNEIVAGSSDGKVYVINASGNQVRSYTIGVEVKSVAVGNVDVSTPENEIAVGVNNNTLYLLDSSANQVWSYYSGMSGIINGVVIGNVSADEGNEIIFGSTDYRVYVINASGNQVRNVSVGASVNDVAVGNVDVSTPENEIVVGAGSTVYLLNSALDEIWSNTTGGTINTIAIGDITTEYSGNEIVVGCSDYKVYAFNSTGHLFWTHTTNNWVRGIDVGNVTTDEGNEVIAGTRSQAPTINIYILNFEYYPTNVSIDVGNDGDYDWNDIGKLRTSVTVPDSILTQAIQDYLDNICTSQSCDVPLVFHSDGGGDLNVTSINVTYLYNASEAISYVELANTWSRTNNTEVNENIGNEVKSISFSTPANEIEIKYVKVNETATICDFGGEQYSTTTFDGEKFCNISSNPVILSDSSLPSTHFLWDDSMSTGTPILGSETSPTVDVMTGTWSKNFTIWNETSTTFYNVTANTNVEVLSDEGLFVEWYGNGTFYDITPSTYCPSFEKTRIGTDDFFSCKEDPDNDGVAETFRWKQPHTSTVVYTINGSVNSPPILSNESVTPSSGIWGTTFNYKINVSDPEGNNVTVHLWVYLENLNAWERIASKNTTTNTSQTPETLSFSVDSNKSWVRLNEYKFEYFDFNGTTGEPYHPSQTTSEFSGPTVLKHDVSFLLIEGNDTHVNRTGLNHTTFKVVITDTNLDQNVSEGVNCALWVTTDGIDFILTNTTTTDSLGFCNFTFDPDASYDVGLQRWRIGTYQDAYYNDNNSENYTVSIYGELNVGLTQDIIDRNFTRGSDILLTAKLYDENLNDVAMAGYTCTWYINSLQVASSLTNATGYCNYTWVTNCGQYSDLGVYQINVTLSDGISDYYIISRSEDNTNVFLKGTLNVTILFPTEGFVIYERQNLMLNSSVNDDCGTQESYSYDVNWYSPVKWMTGGGSCPDSSLPEDTPIKIAEGINTSWTLNDSCIPHCSQVIIANATGDLYNFDQKSVSIYIFGFSVIEFVSPTGNTVWRNETYDSEEGLVKIVCKVTSNVSGSIINYPVNFWDGENPIYIGRNTNATGHAEVEWNISSNITVPEGDHTIKCNISDFLDCSAPPFCFNVSVPEASSTVTVLGPEDWIPPTFLNVHANSIEQYKENVTIEANVTDYFGVDRVWVIITYPNGTNFTQSMTNISSTTWRYTQNFTELGDYDFTIFANDTTGNQNQTSGWFEVYLPIILTGSITNWDGSENMTAKLTFYRNGTKHVIHEFSTNSSSAFYNLTAHKRLYDVEVKVLGHTILFYDVNTTATAERQFNTTEVTNITEPLNFTNVPITLIKTPKTITKLVALDIRNVFVNSITTITLNYSTATNFDNIVYEPAVEIFRCSDWDWGSTDPCASEWVELGGDPDTSFHTVSINVSSTSGYAAVEAAQCGDGYCHSGESCGEAYYCPEDCGACPSGKGGTGGEVGGGPGTATATTTTPLVWLFSVRTNLTEPQLNPGVEETYALWVTNNANYRINVSVSATGTITKFISFEKKSLLIEAKKEEVNKIYVLIPSTTEPGTYTGHVVISGDGKTEIIPVTITVTMKGAAYLDLIVEARNKRVGINETARFRIMLYNFGYWKKLDLVLRYLIKDFETEEILFSEKEEKSIETSTSFDKKIPLSGLNIPPGKYLFEVTVDYDGKTVSASDDFEVVESFWTTDRINKTIILSVAVSSIIAILYARKRYIAWKLAKARYIFPIDFGKLPKGKIWLGKIAETDVKAYFRMDELRTHVLTAGATGSGKSVSAMIFVEELLREKIPVIVFDPTAQWTGFVRPCRDPNLLKYYKEFGMDTRDARPYTGMIYEVTDPNVKIDFDKYMNPGEITVFTLNKLKPGEYDDAVRNIIDTIFAHGWEESTKLRMVVVFDEVHRLLEKYGGKGGYVALEKACREFRKWGIGLIMVSQVLSDFKEAIKGNVLTEIQLHTKSLGDLSRIEKKYGLDYAKRVTKLEVGVGMMQNPRYNEGRPWFIAFRPTWHEPHKIPDKDMEIYKEYATILGKIEAKIESMEKAGKDVFDLKTELKLAKDKLKKGRFRMAKIYIDSLKKHLSEG
jgi:hypothetical protein